MEGSFAQHAGDEKACAQFVAQGKHETRWSTAKGIEEMSEKERTSAYEAWDIPNTKSLKTWHTKTEEDVMQEERLATNNGPTRRDGMRMERVKRKEHGWK